MQARGRERSGQFWWRAAEPIPTRPEPLAPMHDAPDTPDAAARGAPPYDASRHVQPATAPGQFSDGSRVVPHRVDLGAVRPAQVRPQPRPVASQRPAHDRHPGNGLETVAGVEQRGARRSASSRRGGWPRLRRRHALLAAGLAGALVYAAVTGFGRHVRHVEALPNEVDRLLVAVGFGINEISISGHRHTLDQDIFRALGAGRSTLLSLDVRAARQRIEALSWVESATLVRVFPDKLKIELRERTPAAVWLDGERTALVDAEGRVLSYVASFVPPELPRIAGPGAPEAAAELREALHRFPAVASRLHLARRIGQRRWDLELANASTIRLAAGPSSESLDRLMRLEQETRWLDQRGQVVDLTAPRTIAVSVPNPPARPL